jgi:hypothetical protein
MPTVRYGPERGRNTFNSGCSKHNLAYSSLNCLAYSQIGSDIARKVDLPIVSDRKQEEGDKAGYNKAGKPGEVCFMYHTNHVRRLEGDWSTGNHQATAHEPNPVPL